jgi:hypothetical protein
MFLAIPILHLLVAMRRRDQDRWDSLPGRSIYWCQAIAARVTATLCLCTPVFPLVVGAGMLRRLRTKEHDSRCGNFGRWQVHESTNISAAFIQIHSSSSRLLKNVHCIFVRVNLDWLYCKEWLWYFRCFVCLLSSYFVSRTWICHGCCSLNHVLCYFSYCCYLVWKLNGCYWLKMLPFFRQRLKMLPTFCIGNAVTC